MYAFDHLQDLPPKGNVEEVTKYCLELSEAENEQLNNDDVLGWWRVHATHFPSLSILARKYLCIPATSASSERSFSTAGRIVEKRRTSLSAEIVDSLLVLHDN